MQTHPITAAVSESGNWLPRRPGSGSAGVVVLGVALGFSGRREGAVVSAGFRPLLTDRGSGIKKWKLGIFFLIWVFILHWFNFTRSPPLLRVIPSAKKSKSHCRGRLASQGYRGHFLADSLRPQIGHRVLAVFFFLFYCSEFCRIIGVKYLRLMSLSPRIYLLIYLISQVMVPNAVRRKSLECVFYGRRGRRRPAARRDETPRPDSGRQGPLSPRCENRLPLTLFYCRFAVLLIILYS